MSVQANTVNPGVKIIKRYQNRKLYDTQQSCYVTLDDIAKMIRQSEEVVVVDNKTKRDITAATLTQIIFEAEKKAAEYAPLMTLREIIRNQNGSISSYLSKLGVFPASAREAAREHSIVEALKNEAAQAASFDDLKSTLDKRVAAAQEASKDASKAAATNYSDDDVTPELPNSNQNFNH